MDRLSSFSLQVLMLILVPGMLPGCQHMFPHKSQVKGGPPLPAPILPGAPVVTVVGTFAPHEQLGELELLTTQVGQGLSRLGGLRIVDCASPVSESGYSALGKKYPAGGGIQLVDFEATDGSEIPVPLAPVPPELPGDSLTDPIEVCVRIDEFIAYRPMRLNATFTVNNARTGVEITAFQGTWYGQVADEHFGQMTPPGNFSLKRPSTRPFTEANALASLSPQRFLCFVAAEVTPEIHAACLSQGSVIIVSGQ